MSIGRSRSASAMVEAIIAGIDGARTTAVTVRLFPTDAGKVELIVKADVAPGRRSAAGQDHDRPCRTARRNGRAGERRYSGLALRALTGATRSGSAPPASAGALNENRPPPICSKSSRSGPAADGPDSLLAGNFFTPRSALRPVKSCNIMTLRGLSTCRLRAGAPQEQGISNDRNRERTGVRVGTGKIRQVKTGARDRARPGCKARPPSPHGPLAR